MILGINNIDEAWPRDGEDGSNPPLRYRPSAALEEPGLGRGPPAWRGCCGRSAPLAA